MSTETRNVILDSLHPTLENDFLRVELNSAGDITRVFDKKSNREVLSPNTIGNQFQAFEDRPKSWDAWDVDIFYDDKMWLAEPARSIKFVEYGELRQTIEIKRKIQDSEFTQRISLNHNSARLDFDTHFSGMNATPCSRLLSLWMCYRRKLPTKSNGAL